MEMTKEFKLWADECSKIFGGLDWFAIDVAHGKDGNDYILELNGSAIGLTYWKEDTLKIRDMCIKRMNSLFTK
jgi:synapsin